MSIKTKQKPKQKPKQKTKKNIKGGSIFSSNNNNNNKKNEFKLNKIINKHNNIGEHVVNSKIEVKSKKNSVKISGHYSNGPMFFSNASIKFKNNGNTQIKIPVVGKLLINNNGELYIKDISTKIYSLFLNNETDLIKNKIKQYFPRFIRIVKPHIAIIKDNPKKFKYILYKALQKPDSKKIISLVKELFNSNNHFQQTMDYQLDMFIQQALNILENILKDINVSNNNLNKNITDKIHLQDFETNQFGTNQFGTNQFGTNQLENVANQMSSVFKLFIDKIKK